ncbi:hypothetical protein SAMN04490244_1138 [Tranquillimonas rosea]|uniref:Uncharacterized protein n=1 Tax=Tranquillimonas rosea TaxID=641238 RepID=A0A1H9WSR6_9RHOB|nr:hypothetical protein [Tranquillimonas rosea]SES36980.1 hypothetical protein SAMN04490244_1138 [Tranquillimonas rosea]
MSKNLLKSILLGYGPALVLAAVAVVALHWPVWLAVLGWWIIGAALTLGVAWYRVAAEKQSRERHANTSERKGSSFPTAGICAETSETG